MSSYRCNKCGKRIEGDNTLLKKFEAEPCGKGGAHQFQIYAKWQLDLHGNIKSIAVGVGILIFGVGALVSFLGPVLLVIIPIVAVVLIVRHVKAKKKKESSLEDPDSNAGG
jgi:hypothetical protein